MKKKTLTKKLQKTLINWKIYRYTVVTVPVRYILKMASNLVKVPLAGSVFFLQSITFRHFSSVNKKYLKFQARVKKKVGSGTVTLFRF